MGISQWAWVNFPSYCKKCILGSWASRDVSGRLCVSSVTSLMASVSRTLGRRVTGLSPSLPQRHGFAIQLSHLLTSRIMPVMVNVDHPLRFMVECFMLMVNSSFWWSTSTVRPFWWGLNPPGLVPTTPQGHPGQDFEKLLSDQAGGQGPGMARGPGSPMPFCCSKQLGFVAGTGP